MRSQQTAPPPSWERNPNDAASSKPSAAAAVTPRRRDRRYAPRDYSPRPPPPQGHSRIYPEYSPSHSDRPFSEDQRRHGRDNRNPFRRSPTLNAPSIVPARPLCDTSIVTATRSLTVPISTTSTTQPSPKDRTDNRDHSLAPLSWKPLKWARTSSSPLPAKEERALNVLVPPVKEASIASPVTSPSVGDDLGTSRKKARLGWGQGLAKYEKAKVQGSVESSGTRSGGPGEGGSSGAGDAGVCEPVTAASCPSPVTPLSVTSRSPAIPAEKQSTSMVSIDENISHQNGAESDTKLQSKDFSMKLDLSVNSVGVLSALLADLLQPEDACTGDSTFMNKVSMLKVDISKELEKTESEIDSLELELKSLDSETKSIVAHQAHAPLPAEEMPKPGPGVSKDCNKLVSEEIVGCSEKQEGMLVDSKIEDQEIGRCSDEPSTSKDDDNNLAPGEAKGSSLVHSILAANKDATELAAKSFGVVSSEVDIWELVKGSWSRTNNLRIKEKLAVRKRQMKFKEQVLALKFLALKHLWKEDLKVLNMKNSFTKSGKRMSLCSVPLQCSSQKPRSHIRSQLPLTDENSPLVVPSTKTLEYSSKLLSSSRIKQYRSYQKMPSLIIDSKEKESRQFPTTNGLIEDPVSFERNRCVINPWTSEEKEVFMEMLATFGKDFTRISSFLDHKTTADCIEFYYKNHKSESFAEVRKRLSMKKKESQLKLQQLAQSGTFLMATSRKWSQESNAAALDILGAASMVAACNQTSGLKVKQKGFSSKSRGNHCAVERKEFVAVHVPSSIGRALSSSEAMSSCVTTSTDPTGKSSHFQPVGEEDACSEESCGGELVSADWTDEEKALFVQAYNTHGKDFSKISHRLGTRSRDQCKVFFCKAQKSLGLDFANHSEDNDAAGVTLPGNGDTNCGRSDTDDGPAEMDSGVCSTQSCSKAAGDIAMTSEAVAKPENATDGISEQEVGGAVVDSEIFDCFPEKQETVSDGCTDLNEKPVTEEGKLGSEPVLNENENASLTCTGKESLPDIKKTINLELMVDQSRAECAEAGSDPALHATGARNGYQCKDANEKPINILKERVSSGPSVVLHQTGTARSRRRASIDLGATSSVISFASDPGASESLISKPAFATGYLSQVPSNSRSVVLKENNVNNWSVHFGSGPTSNPSGSICFSGQPLSASQRTLNFEEQLSRSHQNVSTASNPLQQYMQKNNQLVNQTQSSHVLKGYPLQMPNHKVISNETGTFNHVQGSNVSQPNQFFGLASNARYNPVTEISMAQKRDDRCDFSVPPASQPVCSTENDAPCRTGDVKLFGKILTQPSSQKVCSKPPSPKPKDSSSSMQKGPNLSVPNGHSYRAPLFSMPVGASSGNQLGLDVVPVKSQGFWDRDCMRPGFASLPKSARMMAKFQDSFAGALPFYPGKDGTNSNVHINLSNFQQPHMQQLTSNGGRVDGFSVTVPKDSGVDAVQQFAPNMAGAAANLIRSGGVVSDPVVAMKMHYASNATVFSSSSNGSGMGAWNDVGR